MKSDFSAINYGSTMSKNPRRKGHITTIVPLTSTTGGSRHIDNAFVYLHVSAFLGFRQIQTKSGQVLPYLPQRLRDCDFQLSVDYRDSYRSPLNAAGQLIDAVRREVISRTKYKYEKAKQPSGNTTKMNISSPISKPISLTVAEQDYYNRKKQLIKNGDGFNEVKVLSKYTPKPTTNAGGRSSANDTSTLSLTANERPVFLNASHASNQKPFALLGAALSSVSSVVNFLSYPLGIPMMSHASTSSDLDRRPYFSRTIPTNAGDSLAAAIYFSQHLGVSHVGILYISDPWGRAFHGDLQHELEAQGVSVISASYMDQDLKGMRTSVEFLAQSKYKYFVAVIGTGIWREVFTSCIDNGIMGREGYTWMLTEGVIKLISPSFRLSKHRDGDVKLAKAIHGMSFIAIELQTYDKFEEIMQDFAANKSLQEEFISMHKEPELFRNITSLVAQNNNKKHSSANKTTFSTTVASSYSFPEPTLTLYQYTAFDAAIGLGIAACETPGLFTGEALHRTILNLNYTGVSGPVSFSSETGTRSLEHAAASGNVGLQFGIRNILLKSDTQSTISEDFYSFTSEITSYISIDSSISNPVTLVKDFIYYDNTTNTPLSLPVLVENKHLIHPIAHTLGIILGIMFMTNALWWMIWTIKNQDIPMVRSHQPFFLCQLCIGAFIMCLTIIPLSMQEPAEADIDLTSTTSTTTFGPSYTYLDISCMSIPWLFSIGFVTSFSAIFSKTLRLNQLVRGAMHCRRIHIRPQHVMFQFLFLLSINIALLVLWTIADPLKYQRIPIHTYDSFGRSTESYGNCKSAGQDRKDGTEEADSTQKISYGYFVPLGVVDVTAVVIALYQHYKARNIPTDFAESKHLLISIFTILETGIMASLILLTVTDPTYNFLLRTIFVGIFSLAITLPTFVPNYISVRRQRNPNHTSQNLQQGSSGLSYNVINHPSADSLLSFQIGQIVSSVIKRTPKAPKARFNSSEITSAEAEESSKWGVQKITRHDPI